MFKVAWHPIYIHPVPENHRFPMEKYDLLPAQLIHEGIIEEDQLFKPSTEKVYDYSLHTEEYLKKLFNGALSKAEERASGFKQSKLLIDREICITNGTIEAAKSSMKNKIGFNIAGGTHHAFSNKPEGFCLLNDQAIAADYLIRNHQIRKVLIIDLDVHQGNGTAEILAHRDDIFTFSMHGKNNYPNIKPESNLDIPLNDGTTDKEYLNKLKQAISDIQIEFKPDFIFYQAGVDVLKSDKLGRLSLSLQGCLERDQVVFNYAKELNIPITVTMGGGYSVDIKQILKAHSNTFRAANEII